MFKEITKLNKETSSLRFFQNYSGLVFFSVNLVVFLFGLFFIFYFLFFSFLSQTDAIIGLSHSRDLISSSLVSNFSNHFISFTTTEDLPAGGHIIVKPESGFLIPVGMSHVDVDLSVASSSGATSTERLLASSSDAVFDAVSVVTGSTSPLIDIELNTSVGIDAGTFVMLNIGLLSDYQATGTFSIMNPVLSGSYKIDVETRSQANQLINRTMLMVAVTNPVKTSTTMPKIRSHGSPSGGLAQGTVSTIVSLITNYKATCRYSHIATTSYYDMIDDFSYTGEYFHSKLVTGLVPGTNNFYVRCEDTSLVADDTDYLISFYIESEGDSGDNGSGDDSGTEDESGDDGSGSGSGGGGGGGSGGGTGTGVGTYDPYPEEPVNPEVTFSGWTYPGSTVYLLQDAAEVDSSTVGNTGSFSVSILDVSRGTYTFGLWSQNASEQKTITHNSTFWVEEDTITAVTGIILSPSIEISPDSVLSGETVSLSGKTAPSVEFEAWLYPQIDRPLREDEIRKSTGTANSSGDFSIVLSTDNLISGQYRIKVKTIKDGVGESDFSDIKNLGIGEPADTGSCPNGDLNGDGRVNITDFSIMLYHWGSDNSCADQNDDGIVNLTDFSILMYYWTG